MVDPTKNGVILTIHAQPKSARTEYVGVHGNALKIKVAGHPVEGEANAVLCEFLAKTFSIPQRAVELCSGQNHRHKRVKLTGVSMAEVLEKFGIE